LALETNELQVRQAAGTLPAFQQNLGKNMRPTNDKSYQTQEIALYNLWNNFPEHRIRYLDQSKIGLVQ
jgi:aminopeptidase N